MDVFKDRTRFFNVYDSSGQLRGQIDQACKRLDMNRSQLIRHSVRLYLKNQKLG